MTDDVVHAKAGRMRVARSRGALSGVLLVLLGLWGALVPLVGPYFNFAYTPRPSTTWHWTAARGWYEVLPGGVAVLGGLLLLASSNRLLTVLGGWLGIVAGGWFVVAPQLSTQLKLGSIGSPAGTHMRRQTVEALTFFTGLGALIVLVGALAVGRLSVRAVRDVQAAIRRDEQAEAPEEPVVQTEPVVQKEPEPVHNEPVHNEPVHNEPDLAPVATSGDPDAPYAPQGATPVPDAVPAETVPGGPAYPTTPVEPESSPTSEQTQPAANAEPAPAVEPVGAPERPQRNVPGGPQLPQRYVRGGAHPTEGAEDASA